MIRCIAILIVFALGVHIACGQAKMPISSVSSGAGYSEAGTYKHRGTIGQAFAGRITSNGYILTAGFNAASTVDPLPDIIITAYDVNPNVVAPEGKVGVDITIKNNGNAEIKGNIILKLFLSENTSYEPGVDVELSPQFILGTSLAVSGTIVFPATGQAKDVTIPANTIKRGYQLLAVVDAGNTIEEKIESNNIAAKGITVSTTTGTDTQPPAFTNITKPQSVAADAKIIATVTDNLSGVKKVTFFHRPAIAGGDFVPEETVKDGDNYSATLKTSWADDVGIEGYFIASDGSDNTSQPTAKLYVYVAAPDNQAIPNLRAGGLREHYTIFSIPYQLSDNSINEIFKNLGSYDKTKWRIVRYQGGKNVDKNEGLTKIERGQGFWFNSVEKVEIKIGAGTTVNKDQSPDFSMALEKGYNQIGNPFTFDINWADVIAKNQALGSKLSHTLLTYNSTNISLEPSAVLKSWGGGFVLADEAMTISMPVSLKNGAGRIESTQITNTNPDEKEWRLPISIHQGGVLNTIGGIGMHPDASLSKDIYDIITPPKFMKYVGISTLHNDFFEKNFSTDIVPTSSNYNWNFNVESDANTATAEISWDNHELAVANAELLMYDVDQKTLIDMKQSDRYTFDPQRSRSFRIFFGSNRASLKPDIQECGVAWPNPIAEHAYIPYLVKETAPVRIDIYDLVGRHISTVVDGYNAPGYHIATWNRTGSAGERVSPGVYLYRMNGSTNVGRIIVN